MKQIEQNAADNVSTILIGNKCDVDPSERVRLIILTLNPLTLNTYIHHTLTHYTYTYTYTYIYICIYTHIRIHIESKL